MCARAMGYRRAIKVVFGIQIAIYRMKKEIKDRRYSLPIHHASLRPTSATARAPSDGMGMAI